MTKLVTMSKMVHMMNRLTALTTCACFVLAAIEELQKLHGVESYKLELTAEEKLERQTILVCRLKEDF